MLVIPFYSLKHKIFAKIFRLPILVRGFDCDYSIVSGLFVSRNSIFCHAAPQQQDHAWSGAPTIASSFCSTLQNSCHCLGPAVRKAPQVHLSPFRVFSQKIVRLSCTRRTESIHASCEPPIRQRLCFGSMRCTRPSVKPHRLPWWRRTERWCP